MVEVLQNIAAAGIVLTAATFSLIQDPVPIHSFLRIDALIVGG